MDQPSLISKIVISWTQVEILQFLIIRKVQEIRCHCEVVNQANLSALKAMQVHKVADLPYNRVLIST